MPCWRGNDPALIVGGVVGDWIKGRSRPLPPDLARGVALHRPSTAMPRRIRPFSAVATGWRQTAAATPASWWIFSRPPCWPADQPACSPCRWPATAAEVYAHIAARLDELPESSRHAMRLMAGEDWLHSYAGWGIADVLRRMAQRARQPNPLAGGEQAFRGRGGWVQRGFCVVAG